MQKDEILQILKSFSKPEIKILKEVKFGIVSKNSWGVYQKDLGILAKKIGKDTALGIELFDTGIYDARLLGAKICRPKEISEELMEYWITQFDTWEICDSFCMKIFKFHDLAVQKAITWSTRNNEFEKRAGFVLMATYGFADKKAPNAVFEQFFPLILLHSDDDRIYVKKAVNWALRQIGKRNTDLQQKAIDVAHILLRKDSKSAQWIAKDALKELQSNKVNVLDYPRNLYRKKD